MSNERSGCMAIRVEYTDGTVVEFIEFDLAGHLESDAVLFDHRRHGERMPPRRTTS